VDQQEDSILVHLGNQREYVENRLRSGAYTSSDELFQAALEALQREEATTSEWIHDLVSNPPVSPKLRTSTGEEIHEVRAFRFRSQDRDF
jgi:Arc/MetJ-type ribon-helix-helix transcriptional regulator